MMIFVLLALECWAQSGVQAGAGAQTGAEALFDSEGRLAQPKDYREWVYMGTGLGMTYFDAGVAQAKDAPFFDSVFVNPAAWKQYKSSGVWPEGTIFVLEIRYAAGATGISKAGFFQTDMATLEAAVKDTKRFAGGWGYFEFGNALFGLKDRVKASELKAGCVACHTANGAVEQTFTQFYPEALAVAKQHKTLKANYVQAIATPLEFSHTLGEQGWAAAKALLEQAAAKNGKALILNPAQQNQVGYALWQQGKRQEALRLFEHVTEINPGSANAWDSLAEALERNGETARAIRATEKGLASLESDASLRPGQKEQLETIAKERLARLQVKK